VYTPLNPELMVKDESLLKDIPKGIEVIKTPISEPYSLYKLFLGEGGSSLKPGFINPGGDTKNKKRFKEHLSLFIRSNLFIPDLKFLWIRPSVFYLRRYLEQNRVDAIVSTGPPHSMHLIARRVSKITGIPWLADFRDPWTNVFNFKYLRYTSLVTAIHKRLEKRVVKGADIVVTVTETIANEYRELAPEQRVEVVTNGFDSSDFSKTDIHVEEGFTITYTGLLVPTQNPSVLWKVLGERVKEQQFAKNLKLRMIGNIDSSVLEEIKENGLEENLIKMDYIPHNEVVLWQQKARVLLLSGGDEPESKGILTGKLFEYMATRRPILGFGPKGGEMDRVLEESNAGGMFDFDDYEGVSEWIDSQYRLYVDGAIPVIESNIAKYSRKELTAQIASLLDELTNK